MSPKLSRKKLLANQIELCAQYGFPLNRMDIRVVIKTYLDTTGMAVPFFKNSLSGVDWVHAFLNWHKTSVKERIANNIKDNINSSVKSGFRAKGYINSSVKSGFRATGLYPQNVEPLLKHLTGRKCKLNQLLSPEQETEAMVPSLTEFLREALFPKKGNTGEKNT